MAHLLDNTVSNETAIPRGSVRLKPRAICMFQAFCAGLIQINAAGVAIR